MASELNNKDKPSICFVAHNAYGEISGVPTGHIGGIEKQQTLMARWLARQGHRVSMITWDEGQDHGVRFDGVTVLKCCRRDAGVKGLRFFHPSWTSLIAAMRRADADVYYQNCGEFVTGQAAMWCRRHGRKFVYSVASDPDVDRSLPAMKSFRERFLYRYGLRRADAVIVQTLFQQRCLHEQWGISSVVIPMLCDGPDGAETPLSRSPDVKGARILWIGRIGREKRLELLLDIADQCPDLHFDVVGRPHVDDIYIRELLERADRLDNVTMHGYVPYKQTGQYYRQASLLCCTSAYEGFPNTFLEAWSHALPVVSTFDPDNVVAEHALGAIAGDVPGLVDGIFALLESPQRYNQAAENAHRYYLERHAVDVVMPRFQQVFIDVVSNNVSA